MTQIDLNAWLARQRPALAEVVRAIAGACAEISRACARGGVSGELPEVGASPADGEEKNSAGIRADRCLSLAMANCTQIAAWASQDQAEVTVSDEHGSAGTYVAVLAALHGTAHIDCNVACGTIFSVMPHLFRGTPASAAAFMQPGKRQVAAGYAMYGPATVLVLSLGQGVQVFTLDPQVDVLGGRWLLSREDVQVPQATSEVAVDVSNQRFWEKPVQRYVAECLAGESGPRGRDFELRWLDSLVAEVHRILNHGGLFMDPRDNREPFKPGRLQLMYEASPMAWLMEQAGGASSTGTAPLLEFVPDALHQQVPVILGSRDEVQRIVAYHEDPSENVSRQLFKTRSLFIQPNA
jgi:fructose-1,6-bisphosphatase